MKRIGLFALALGLGASPWSGHQRRGSRHRLLFLPVLFAALTGAGLALAGAVPTQAQGGSPATLTGDCDCILTGPYVDPAEGVNIDVSHDGTSPGGKYQVTVSTVGAPPGLANVTVTRVSDNRTVLTAQSAFWGFSPDDDRFVTHYGQLDPEGVSIHLVALYDLTGAPPLAPIWASMDRTQAARIQFSPSGRFLFYTDIVVGPRTQLTLVDAHTGTVKFSDSIQPFPGAPIEGKDSFGTANWGFGPNDSRFVYGWPSGQTDVQWNLVNLERTPQTSRVQNVPLLDDVSAYWQFSPCGDVIGLVHNRGQMFVNVDVYNTRNETAAGPGAQIPAPVQLLELHTETISHVATNTVATSPTTSESTDYTLGPNNAAASCGANLPPTASFTPPTGPRAGVEATFRDTSTDSDGTIAAREWDFGDGGSSAERDPAHTYLSSGTFTVSLTVTDDDGATDTVSEQLVVAANAAPHASFTFSPNAPSRGDIVTFTDTSTDDDGIVERNWSIGSQFFTGPGASVLACETFDAGLTVRDHVFQSDTVTVRIVVDPTPRVIQVPAGASLAAAVATACPGDTLSLAAGTYAGGVTLDGVHIEGAGAGQSIVSGAADPEAGGWVLQTRGDVAIADLSVRNGRGGILAGGFRGTARLDRVEVDHNSGFSGIFVDCCQTDLLIVDRSSIHHNDATERGWFGGGIGMFCCASVTVTNSEIAYNTSASDGGGAEPYEADKVVFTGNNVHDNIAAGVGGGLLVNSFGPGDVIANNRFVRNTALHGAGLSVSGRVLLAGNLIAQNHGSGLETPHDGPIVVANATIADNTGLGIENTSFARHADIHLYNSIVAGDRASLVAQRVCRAGSNLTGTLPAFADSSYHVAPGSPAIDAGDDTKVPSELATDADGQPRIQDGDGDGTPRVDLGYVEFPGAGGGTGGVGAIDTTSCDGRPTVTAVTPPDGATGVSPAAAAAATFSRAMDAATITASSFTLTPSAGGGPVAATVSYEAGTNTARLTPSVRLTPSTLYTAMLDSTIAADLIALAAPVTWSFTTGAEEDTTPPTIVAPADVSAAAGDACTASVDPGTPNAEDGGAPLPVSGERSDGLALDAAYPLGPTTITWTATDAAGNVGAAAQTVTVVDETPPAVTAPVAASADNDPGRGDAVLDPGTASASDNCPGVTVHGSRSDGAALSAPYAVGTTTITWTAADAAGNTASAMQAVVVRDVEPPSISVPSQVVADATSPSGAGVSYTASAVDNVGVASFSCSPASDSTFAIGDTMVTCTAADAAGNAASASFVVQVRGAAEQLAELAASLTDVSLKAKAQAAAASAGEGRANAACNQLSALLNEADAQEGKMLTAAETAAIRELVARIRAVLGC